MGTIYYSNVITSTIKTGVQTQVTATVSIPAGTYLVTGRTSFAGNLSFDLLIKYGDNIAYMQRNSNLIVCPITFATDTTICLLAAMITANIETVNSNDNNLTWMQLVKIK